MVFHTPGSKYFLYMLKIIAGNKRLVRISYIVTFEFAVIDSPLFGDRIDYEGLLQQQVTAVFLIGQNPG